MMTIENAAGPSAAHSNGKTSAQIDAIFRELANLRAENRRMRDRLSARERGSQIVRRALVDAHTLIMAAFSGDSTGRKAMEADGMTKRRWAWAVAFLRYAGIVSFRNKTWRSGLDFVVLDLEEAIRLLERAAIELDRPDGYRRLRQLLKQV